MVLSFHVQTLSCRFFNKTGDNGPFLSLTNKHSPAGFLTKQVTMALSFHVQTLSCRFFNKTGDNGPFLSRTNTLLTPAGFPTKPSVGETTGRGTSDRPAQQAPPRGQGWRRGWSTAPGRPSPPRRGAATTCRPSAPTCRSLCPPEPHTRRCTLRCRLAGKIRCRNPLLIYITLHVTRKLQRCYPLLMCCAAGNQENTVLQLTADVCCTVGNQKYSVATYCWCVAPQGNQENTVLQPTADLCRKIRHRKPRTSHILDWKTNKPQNMSRNIYDNPFFLLSFPYFHMLKI